jgi:phage replication O-like protein O
LANPQIENGYTKIANEILEALAHTRIPGEARQILDVIFRQTYGWGKKQDRISLTQFVKSTGIKKPHVIRSIKKLQEMNIITVAQKGNDFILTYCLNKNYDNWNLLPKKVTLPKKVIPVANNGNEPLPIMVPTKERIKDNNKRNKTYDRTLSNQGETLSLIDWFESAWKIYPRKEGKKESLKHFNATIKTDNDLNDFLSAINNYIDQIEIKKTELQYIKHGKTFFNNWRDYANT